MRLTREELDFMLAEFREQHGYEWPNCITPDCEYKQCTWCGLPYCGHCATAILGKAEMDRRYHITHPNKYWDGSVYKG